jgi:hypothetical protein
MELDNKALVLDMLEWIAARPRTHAEVMDAWRTSCPRLQIWEDATDLGLVVREGWGESEMTVSVTAAGREFLALERPRPVGMPLGDPIPGV